MESISSYLFTSHPPIYHTPQYSSEQESRIGHSVGPFRHLQCFARFCIFSSRRQLISSNTVKLRLHRGQRWVHWLGRSACVGPTTLSQSRGRPRGASGSPAGGRPAPGPPPTRPNPLLIWSPDPSATKSHLQACYKLYGSFKTF